MSMTHGVQNDLSGRRLLFWLNYFFNCKPKSYFEKRGPLMYKTNFFSNSDIFNKKFVFIFNQFCHPVLNLILVKIGYIMLTHR